MMDPVRTRRNRRDTSVTGTDPVLGAVVWAKEYPTGRVDVRVKAAAPPTADAAGRYADGLLPDA